ASNSFTASPFACSSPRFVVHLVDRGTYSPIDVLPVILIAADALVYTTVRLASVGKRNRNRSSTFPSSKDAVA
ncbi:hypothetical protein, partial [Chromohalobacter sp. 48-RD10]|uniref:hypothetical protein n=1 Tax=Chromohalobacter sp. 48-RD10 TaxID=2994063 RepID=UPI0024689277